MMRTTAGGVVIALGIQSADAHDFVLRYDLPVPFELYLYACAATLVATFVLLGWFLRPAAGPPLSRTFLVRGTEPIGRLPAWATRLLRSVGLACFGLTVAAGLVGTKNPDTNIGPTLFWHGFLLGLMYATALVGDVYAFLNPWKSIVEWVQGRKTDSSQPRVAYPPGLGYWPAVVCYIALIWIELFTHPGPRGLAVMLIAYSAITFTGVWLFGKAMWFRFGEMFSVLLRIVAMLAPIVYQPGADSKSFNVHWRSPVTAILQERADHMSLVVFVLFMLSSTTYDGIHQTIFWMGLFWNRLLVVLQPLWGTDLLASQVMLERWYGVYQRAGLVLSPFFYLAIYLGVLGLVKAVTRTTIPLRSLALEFVFSIVPIAFVYNLAHYYTLLLTQAPRITYLVSDPFGFGWDPFGIGRMGEPPTLDVATVWHTEVALILIGHVVSVYLAHRVALRLFASRREAMISQLPMLLLMVAYTVIGLWVISLPFALISK